MSHHIVWLGRVGYGYLTRPFQCSDPNTNKQENSGDTDIVCRYAAIDVGHFLGVSFLFVSSTTPPKRLIY